MMIGSLLLPKLPASKSAPPFAVSCAGSPAATLTDAARTIAATTSRLRRIAVHRRVDVVEEPDVLRTDVHLHATPADVERPAVDGHDPGRGDQVVLAVVRGLVGDELEVVEVDGDAAAELERLHVAPLERHPALRAGEVRRTPAVLQEQRHLRLDHDDLVLLLEVARVLGGDLPDHPSLLHLHATEVLDALRDLGEEVLAELLERLDAAGSHVARHEVPDCSEGGA